MDNGLCFIISVILTAIVLYGTYLFLGFISMG